MQVPLCTWELRRRSAAIWGCPPSLDSPLEMGRPSISFILHRLEAGKRGSRFLLLWAAPETARCTASIWWLGAQPQFIRVSCCCGACFARKTTLPWHQISPQPSSSVCMHCVIYDYTQLRCKTPARPSARRPVPSSNRQSW